jgi:hypothetical protein
MGVRWVELPPTRLRCRAHDKPAKSNLRPQAPDRCCWPDSVSINLVAVEMHQPSVLTVE